MFKKMKVTSVRASAFSGEKNEGTQISAKQFGQINGSKLTITGFLVDENDVPETERTQIVFKNAELGPIKAALLKDLERGQGILEGELTNPRSEDDGIEYPLKRVDLKLSNEDGSKAFNFKPAVAPNWVDTKEFGEIKVTAVNYGTTQEQRDAFKDLRNARSKRA